LAYASGQSYFVSPTGDDNADGQTPATAWKTVGKVNAMSFAPGSQVYFQRGGEWHDQLVASSSGTATEPITYADYGTGAKPIFWGSDPLANNGFSRVNGTGSTYAIPASTPVNSVFANHEFMHSAALNTSSTDPAVNRQYVDANPNTWTYDNGTLYVNTGGANPASSGTTYTAAVRDNVVYSFFKSNVTFKNLVVEESARASGGYAFGVYGGSNVHIVDSEGYRAGKHTFGVANSGGFIGKGLFASDAMPDQGYGGASAFAMYANVLNASNANSTWADCTADNNHVGYPAFITHGDGVGDVHISNMVVHGGLGIVINTEAPYPQLVEIEGGHLDNAGITLNGNGVRVNGVRLTGEDAFLSISGKNNLIQNSLIAGAKPRSGYQAAIVDQGTGNTLQFNTVVLDPTTPENSTALAIQNPSVDTKVLGNIFDVPGGAVRKWFFESSLVDSEYNLYSPDAYFFDYSIKETLASWIGQGMDIHGLLADPTFIDALNGDYSLAPNSPALDRILAAISGDMPASDFAGGERPLGEGYDAGAFEAVPEPGTVGVLVAGAGIVGCMRRRRNR
jgi:hypothetical protein